MEHTAIVERQGTSWYVHVPELSLGAVVEEPSDTPDVAERLLARATGLAPGQMRVDVRLVRASDLLVSTASSPIRARHFDGVWRVGQRRGWVRGADRSWRALVCYLVDGVLWERTLSPSQITSPTRSVTARSLATPGFERRRGA